MSNLQLTNSLSGKKEIFKPINPKKISLYACGPTVYDNPHVGNARTLVVFDILFRVLKVLYNSKVTYVRNITDVDDKIIEASQNNQKDINEITNSVIKIFHKNCKSLNCLEPTIEPKATEHIKEMIEMTTSLINKGFAYENKGHVYFEVKAFKNYGKLSNKNLDELKAGSRVEISVLKKILWILYYGSPQKKRTIYHDLRKVQNFQRRRYSTLSILYRKRGTTRSQNKK